jgi:hypothetical protein
MTAQMVRRSLGEQVYLVYVDESRQDKKHDLSFLVVCALLVKDEQFDAIEQHLAYGFYESVGLASESFKELHASDLWNRNKPFQAVPRSKAREVFSSALDAIQTFKLPVVYGAVNLGKLLNANFGSATAEDYAFRMCVRGVEQWFCKEQPSGIGLLIADDTPNPKLKEALYRSYYLFRNRVRSSPAQRGELEHLHDDMYFGDSKYSTGIQLVDLCAFLIGRHHAQYEDTEEFYLRLQSQIFKGDIEP